MRISARLPDTEQKHNCGTIRSRFDLRSHIDSALIRSFYISMRRWFAILLLVLLPLQTSWAVVANYCDHEQETGQTTQHFGHHEHKHEGATESGSKSKSLTGFDSDCVDCHLSTPVTLTDVFALPLLISVAFCDQLPASPLHPLPGDVPERPNWISPA